MPTTAEYLKALKDSVYKTASLVQRDLQSTTRTWDHKPKFDITITQQGENYIVAVGTDDLIYLFVSEGTKPHIIQARRAPYLAFQGGYRAKTRVGIIGSNPGGGFGPTIFAQTVHHPGTKARKFIANIQKRRQITMLQEGTQAVAKVNRTMK
jgi:hypothetical protein